jgi:CubicO group peptidase (beta-lactamase class C family)
VRYGLGYSVSPTLNPEAGPDGFGHSGAGGSLGFADPRHRIGFGYVMNRLKLAVAVDHRRANLVRATYGCLASA